MEMFDDKALDEQIKREEKINQIAQIIKFELSIATDPRFLCGWIYGLWIDGNINTTERIMLYNIADPSMESIQWAVLEYITDKRGRLGLFEKLSEQLNK